MGKWLFIIVCFVSGCAEEHCKIFPVNIDDKTGFINGKGEMVIEPEYKTKDPNFWPQEHFSDGWIHLKKEFLLFFTKDIFVDSCGKEQLTTHFPWQDDF